MPIAATPDLRIIGSGGDAEGIEMALAVLGLAPHGVADHDVVVRTMARAWRALARRDSARAIDHALCDVASELDAPSIIATFASGPFEGRPFHAGPRVQDEDACPPSSRRLTLPIGWPTTPSGELAITFPLGRTPSTNEWWLLRALCELLEEAHAASIIDEAHRAAERVRAREGLFCSVALAFLREPPGDANALALERIGLALDADRVAVFMPNECLARLRCTHRWSAPGAATTTSSWETLDKYPIPPATFVHPDSIGGDQPVASGEGHLDAWLSALRRASSRRIIYAPIAANGRVFGLLNVRMRAGAEIASETIDELCAIFAAGWVRRARELAALRAKDDAVAATHAKSAFIAKMTHELRTPLNGVVGMVDLLTRTQPTDEQLRYLDIAGRSSRALSSLMDEILDFSKLEAGRLELENEEFSIAKVVEDATSILSLSAERKGIELVGDEGPAFMADRLIGDRKRIQQVLLNLLGNAIKFTDVGSVRLQVDMTPETDSKVRVRFTATDTGCGIAPEIRGKLFQPFVSRGAGGVGLGLAISKELVERMGGRIGAVSEVDLGSTFWFELVLERSRKSATANPAPVERSFRGRILVVEDSQLNAEVVTAMIARTGCDYDLVGDGASALEALTQRPYDLVLMDCHLPDAQGPNLAFDIRCREAQGDFAHERRRIPIVAFTASATKADMEKYRAAGMDDCIAKPTDLPVVMAVLRRHLTPGGDGTRSGNLERTLLRLSGDRELLARIIGQFVTAAAESRINLREACEGRDAHALKFHVHRLRGQASTFDAAYLVRATEKLEESIRDDGVVWPLADAALLAIDAELDRLLAYLAREAVFP